MPRYSLPLFRSEPASPARPRLLQPGLAGYVLAARRRQWPLPPRADGYAGGRFRAHLQDGADVILTPALPTIAASQPSGL